MSDENSIMLPIKSKDLLAFLKTQISYLPGEVAYNDPEIFKEFIGGEVQINADLGRQIVSKLGYESNDPLFFLETCSGPGTMIKDLHLDFPRSLSVGVDLSEEMCALGRKVNPHLTFVQANVADPTLSTYLSEVVRKSNVAFSAFDIALNSASSLGFLSAIQLEAHLIAMNDVLDMKRGAYFAELGYYASVVAASVNNQFSAPGNFRGEKTIDWTVTTKYYPLTDFHEISWSAWSQKTKRLLFAMTHKNRALRPSELSQISKKVGLEFRTWRMVLDSPKHYRFTELDENSFYRFDSGFDVLVEFHRPDSPRLDRVR
jgi:hypothetical protein